MPVSQHDILKTILLKELDRMEPEQSTFEDDPMQFILKKYQGLNTTLEYLMTPSFQEYITGIYVVAPKPTTFKVVLHNGEYFFLQFMGKAYEATVQGKKYYLMAIGEKERCMVAISRILRNGNPLKTKGPEGAEQATRDAEGPAEEEGPVPPAETGGEEGGEELKESTILEAILSNFSEAYTQFPKSENEIENKYVKQLYKTIKAYSDIEDPIAMDPTKDKNIIVKITRKLQQDPKFIKHLETSLKPDLVKTTSGDYKLGNVKIEFGEGSRGGRGVKSKGLGFEGSLAGDLEKLSKEGITKQNADSFTHPKLIAEMARELGLKKGNFTISLDGSANKPRPLTFTASGPEVSFSGESVADTLTDITINKDGKPYYVSAKFGGTLTFFNSGIAKTLPADEIKKGEIKNPNGVALLKALGIDNKSFCAVFNYYAKGKPGQFIPRQVSADIAKLQNLVSSGIGSGYYYAQAGKGEDQFFKIDDKYKKKASTITTTPQVYYGGIDGKGKRIDVVFESDKYYFKVNIRNKQGGIYPTHIMCDYKAK
jgi:hypothetical protein